MDLFNSVLVLYEEIAEKVLLSKYADKLEIKYSKQLDRQTGVFTVVLEIVVLAKKLEHDCGIVFSTNAQKDSHFGMKKGNREDSSLYITTDLSFGNGEIIESLDEWVFRQKWPLIPRLN